MPANVPPISVIYFSKSHIHAACHGGVKITQGCTYLPLCCTSFPLPITSPFLTLTLSIAAIAFSRLNRTSAAKRKNESIKNGPRQQAAPRMVRVFAHRSLWCSWEDFDDAGILLVGWNVESWWHMSVWCLCCRLSVVARRLWLYRLHSESRVYIVVNQAQTVGTLM